MDFVADTCVLRRTLARIFAHNTALTITAAVHRVVYLSFPLATSAQTLTGVKKRTNGASKNGARTRAGWWLKGESPMEETRPTIMTLEEVAKYLRLHKSTVYRMAREGKLPGNKVAGQWRFKKERLVDWFEKQQALEDEL